MLRLHSSKPEERKVVWKPFKPCHFGIHWIVLSEYSRISIHMSGFHSFSGFLHHFILDNFFTSRIRVKIYDCIEKVKYRILSFKIWNICLIDLIAVHGSLHTKEVCYSWEKIPKLTVLNFTKSSLWEAVSEVTSIVKVLYKWGNIYIVSYHENFKGTSSWVCYLQDD